MKSPMEKLVFSWGQPMSEEQMEVYVEALADVPFEALVAAVDRLVLTSEWRPSVAEIRKAVAEVGLPSAEDAVEQFELLEAWDLAWGASVVPLVPCPTVHPTVKAAWTVAGAGAPHGVFAKAWREERERFVVDTAAGSLAAVALGDGSRG